MVQSKEKTLCVNIFKNGGDIPNKADVTNAWIKLISNLEKNKIIKF